MKRSPFIIKTSTAWIIMLLTEMFISCRVSKDVTVTDSGLPAKYAGQSADDTVSAARLPWKTFFTLPELQVLLAEALSNNYDIQVALKNISAADLILRQSRLGNIPVIGLNATVSSSRPSDNSLNGLSLNQYLNTRHIEDYTLAADISWEADIWGKIRSREAAALAAYLNTRAASDAVQTRLISEISKGYFNLLMLDEQLRIAQSNVRLNDSTLQMIGLQYQSGQVSYLAVQQAQAQKSTAEKLVPDFEQQIAIQENAVNRLCGRMPAAIIRTAHLADIALDRSSKAGLPAELLSRRPDVKQAELEVSKANANVGVAKASMYPSLTITAQGGLDAFKASNWFNIPASLFGALTGGLAQPLLQQKKLNTLYKVSVTERDRSVLEFRQTVLNAVGEVSDALIRTDKIGLQQQIATGRTRTLEQATRNAQQLFKNGMANYLEVITAQGNLLQSELELAAINKQQLDAGVDLYRSLGGGVN
jgi:multidrug efflux system outer membrane protein